MFMKHMINRFAKWRCKNSGARITCFGSQDKNKNGLERQEVNYQYIHFFSLPQNIFPIQLNQYVNEWISHAIFKSCFFFQHVKKSVGVMLFVGRVLTVLANRLCMNIQFYF